MNNPNAQKEEQIGRSIFQELADQIGWQVEYTKEQFNPIDLHLQITEHKNGQIYTASGEIKIEQNSNQISNTYNNTTQNLSFSSG